MRSGNSGKSQMSRKHALVIPVSFQAHFAGIYRHAIELGKRGVTITFVALQKEIALLKTFDEVRELDFNLISYEHVGPREASTDDLLALLPSLKNRLQPIFDKLLDDQKAGRPGPTCIIGDRFLAWAVDVAKVLNIPYYQFFSCGAIYARYLQAYPQLLADNILSVKEEVERSLGEFDGLLEISGVPGLEFREMANSFSVDFYSAIGRATGEADGVIVNTFYELEAPQVEAIQQSWIDDSQKKTRRLFLVGPISKPTTFKDRSFVADHRDNRGNDYLQWLDRRPPQSVVYICIGTIARFSAQQIKELALAIEATEQAFLWVIPQGSEKALPPNFEERTREKGLIVRGWVAQQQILAHSAIGGFVTHCGWNSIIESIMAGVPMAAWPQMSNDQFMNCRYLVDVLKIAVEVRPQDPNCSAAEATVSTSSPKTEDNFVRAVRLLMSEERIALRSRVQGLKTKAEAAIAEGGASFKALNDLVECIPP